MESPRTLTFFTPIEIQVQVSRMELGKWRYCENSNPHKCELYYRYGFQQYLNWKWGTLNNTIQTMCKQKNLVKTEKYHHIWMIETFLEWWYKEAHTNKRNKISDIRHYHWCPVVKFYHKKIWSLRQGQYTEN